MSSFSRPSRRFLVLTFFLLVGLLYVLFGVVLALAGDPRLASSSVVLRHSAAGVYGAALFLIWGYIGLRECVSLRNLWLWLLTVAFLFTMAGACILRPESEAHPISSDLLEGIMLALVVGAVATLGTLHRRSHHAVDDSFSPPGRGRFVKRYGRRSRY